MLYYGDNRLLLAFPSPYDTAPCPIRILKLNPPQIASVDHNGDDHTSEKSRYGSSSSDDGYSHSYVLDMPTQIPFVSAMVRLSSGEVVVAGGGIRYRVALERWR